MVSDADIFTIIVDLGWEDDDDDGNCDEDEIFLPPPLIIVEASAIRRLLPLLDFNMNAATTEQQDGCGDANNIAKNSDIRRINSKPLSAIT